MDISKIVGLASLAFSALLGYWLFSPSKTLSADPLNSIVLIIMAIIFAGTGIFLLFFAYLFNNEEE